MFYKSLIEIKPSDQFEDFTRHIYFKYSKNKQGIRTITRTYNKYAKNSIRIII